MTPLARRLGMTMRNLGIAWLAVLGQVIWANAGVSVLPVKETRVPLLTSVPLDKVSERQRQRIKLTLEKPTLHARGPAETFLCRPEHYYFFLDHPDRAVAAWRRLGIKCVSIVDRGQGQFRWSDEQGSEVTWETVARSPHERVWYAEGKVRPGPLLPAVPVRVLVVLRHQEGKTTGGSALINHQSDIYLHTDSKTATLVTRMLGPSANRLAEQGLEQLQLFFSALAWYLDQHPEQAERLLER